MRILYMQPAARFGGAERQAATVIPLLAQSGLDVLTLAGPGATIGRWLRQRGVNKFVYSRNFPTDWRGSIGMQRWTLPFQYARCVLEMAAEVERLVQDQQIELILAAMPFSWLAATRVARKMSIPIIWRVGGNDINSFEAASLSMWCRRWRPDLLLCNGHHVASTYAPLVRAPCEVVHNGVDLALFRGETGKTNRYRPQRANIVLGFAGRLVPQKRPQDFIALAATLKDRYQDVVCLVGGDSPLRPFYQAMARRERADNLRFLGFVDDMPSFYAACDILVLPSESEGCSNVLLEAMASRTAVVASNIPSIREIVRDEVDGYLYSAGNVDGLVRAVTTLIDNQVGRRGLIERGYRRVSQNFSAEQCAQRTTELVRSFAKPHSLLPSTCAPRRVLP